MSTNNGGYFASHAIVLYSKYWQEYSPLHIEGPPSRQDGMVDAGCVQFTYQDRRRLSSKVFIEEVISSATTLPVESATIHLLNDGTGFYEHLRKVGQFNLGWPQETRYFPYDCIRISEGVGITHWRSGVLCYAPSYKSTAVPFSLAKEGCSLNAFLDEVQRYCERLWGNDADFVRCEMLGQLYSPRLPQSRLVRRHKDWKCQRSSQMVTLPATGGYGAGTGEEDRRILNSSFFYKYEVRNDWHSTASFACLCSMRNWKKLVELFSDLAPLLDLWRESADHREDRFIKANIIYLTTEGTQKSVEIEWDARQGASVGRLSVSCAIGFDLSVNGEGIMPDYRLEDVDQAL